MSIYSLVVHTKPENIESVATVLRETEAVEIHGINEKGKLVVTLDHPDRNYCSDTMMGFHNIPGVLNTSLVYEYFEDNKAIKDNNQDNHENNDEDTKESEESRPTTTKEVS